ncbi:hypothetical protein N7462_003586 [Penicillium macrosclerotiorum]|uniref:uncharacterized protein n=1 Tax=Penicillium macrosclerotiorum TaxID=303699 RepID=UPI002548948C|nr:uncharacterized protein N7462_003586 [Penicillium macrosclerotiorum]KAJ5689194.1 hypothetical protein N7462_003586 [Penicillium macrosclerotiorum]
MQSQEPRYPPFLVFTSSTRAMSPPVSGFAKAATSEGPSGAESGLVGLFTNPRRAWEHPCDDGVTEKKQPRSTMAEGWNGYVGNCVYSKASPSVANWSEDFDVFIPGIA